MQKIKVKLNDVAMEAGVSRAAAGKVLNHCGGAIRVGLEARKRIKDAAVKLNYRNNLMAATLAGKQSTLVGVIIDSQNMYRNQRMLTELENAATRRGLRILISYTHDNVDQMRENRMAMEEFGVLGIVCLSHDYYQFAPRIAELFQDCSNIVFLEKPRFPGAVYVSTNDLPALTQLFEAFKSSGRTRIAVLHGNTSSYTEKTLHENYRKAIEANGLTYQEELNFRMPDGYNIKVSAQTAVEKLIIPCKPDAVYCDDANFVICMQNVLKEKKVKESEKMLFYGGNNDPLFSLLSPVVESLVPGYSSIADALLDALPLHESPGCRKVICSQFSGSKTIEDPTSPRKEAYK